MTEIPDDFRMVVLDNSGGGIFRVIGSTAGMCGEMRERYYSGNINLPLRQLADGFGLTITKLHRPPNFECSILVFS